MAIVLRAVLVLGGVLLLYMGSGFLLDPAGSGAGFGVTAEGVHGLTSIQTDFTSFFGVGGACLIWGALAQRRDPLVIGGALMLVALVARLVSLAINGPFDGYIAPIVFEAVVGMAAIWGSRMLPAAKAANG